MGIYVFMCYEVSLSFSHAGFQHSRDGSQILDDNKNKPEFSTGRSPFEKDAHEMRGSDLRVLKQNLDVPLASRVVNLDLILTKEVSI